MATAASGEPATVREIHPGVLYRLDEIKRRSGLGDWALRTARNNGLHVIRRGGKAFVFGGDFIRYMRGEQAE